jgi:LPXTG-motif cell wall-anchored protein
MTGHLAEGSELIDSSYYFTYSDAGGNHTIYYGFADNDFSTSGVYLVDNSGAELSDVSHLSVTSVEVNTSVPNYTEVRAIATTDITVGEASVPIEVRVTMIPNSDGTVIHQYEIVNNGTQTLSGVHLVAGIDTDLTCDEGDAVPVYSLGTNEGMYISGSNSSQPVSVYFPVTTSDDSSYGSTPDNYAAWAWPSSASPSCEGCSFSGVQDALTNGSLWGVTHASGDQLLTGVDSAVQFGWASTDIAAGATSDFLYNVGLGFTVPAPTASVTAPNFSLYPGSDSTTAGPACDPDYVVFNNVDTQTDSTLVDVTLDNTAADFAGNLTGTIQFGTGYGATETYESTVYNLSFAADSNGTVHALVMADGDASPHGIRSFASFGTGDFAKITLNTTDATDGENIGYTVKAYDLGSTTATVPADADAIANLTSSLTSASTSSLIVSGSGNIYVASLPTLSAKDASLTLGTDGTMGLGFTANPTTASAQVSGYAVASGWGDQSGDALLTVTVANPTIARGLSGAYLDFGTGTDPVSLSQFDSTGQATASVPVADLEALSDGTFSLHAIPSVSGDTTYTVSLSYDVSGTTETIDSSSATLSIPVAAAKPAAPAAATPAAALPQTGDMTSLYVVIAALLAMVIGSALLMASRRKRNAMEGKRNNND